MLFRPLRVIYKIFVYCFCLLVSVCLISALLLLSRHDNLPVNSYTMRLLGLRSDVWSVSVGKAEVVAFNKLNPLSFDLKITDLKVFSSREQERREVLNAKNTLLRISLLSILLNRPFISAMSVDEVLLAVGRPVSGGLAVGCAGFAGMDDLTKNILEVANALSPYFKKLYHQTRPIDSMSAEIKKIAFVGLPIELNDAQLASELGRGARDRREARNLRLKMSINNTETVYADILFDRGGIREARLDHRNFDSNFYQELLGADFAGNVFQADSFRIAADYNKGNLGGKISSMRFSLENARGSLGFMNWIGGGYQFSGGDIGFELLSNGSIAFNQSKFTADKQTFSFVGLIDPAAERVALDFMSIDPSADSLYRYLPDSSLGQLKSWLKEHIKQVHVDYARVSVAAEGWQFSIADNRDLLDALKVEIGFREGAMLLSVNGADLEMNLMSGAYVMQNDSSIVDINKASVDNIGLLGAASINSHDNLILEAGSSFAGPAAKAADCMLKYSNNSDFRYRHLVQRAKGKATGGLNLFVPLKDEGGSSFQLASVFADIAIENFIEPLNLTDGGAKITADEKNLLVEGAGKIENENVNFKFSAAYPYQQNTLEVLAYVKASNALRIDAISNVADLFVRLDGQMLLRFDMKNISNNSFGINGRLDLLETDVDFLHLNSHKKEGDEAFVDFSANARNGKVMLNKGAYRADDIGLSLDKVMFSLDRIDYDVRISSDSSKNYDFRFAVAENASDKSLSLIASRFDGRSPHLLKAIARRDSTAERNTNMLIKIDKLTMQRDVEMNNLTLESKCGLYDCEWLDFSVNIAGGGYVSAGYDGQMLCAKAAGIGYLGDAFGLGNFIRKGNAMMCIDSFIGRDEIGYIEGKIAASGLQVVKGGLLSDALSADKSLEGVNKKIKKLNQKVIEFEKMNAKFTYRDGIVNFKNGALYGPLIGLTFYGKLDIDSSSIDINGALLPVYGINSIIAQFPLLGDLMSGGRGGVLGIDYSLKGDIANPTLNVNPLSIFVPGILRSIFDAFRKD